MNKRSIVGAVRGLEQEEFSSVELVRSCLEKIDKGENKSFLTLNQDVIEQAQRADEERREGSVKPLLGVPVAVKDNFCTKGLKTTAGSKLLKDYEPVYTSTVVKKLEGAGALILGKTNMDAWAHGSSTETSDFHPTYNPWDRERVPGGSSGGSAASVIADETIFAIGSETAGSIRQPASWCGITGLKPTYGRVSRYGVIAMGSSVDSPGPLVKTVEDAALVLQVLAGQDPKDATTSPQEVDDYLDFQEIGGLKIGLPREYFDACDNGVASLVMDAARVLEKAGAEIEEMSLLDPKYSIAVYTVLQRSEVSSNLARFDGVRYGQGRDTFGAEAKRRIMLGAYALSSGYYDAYYKKAQKVRTLILEDMREAFEKYDLILAPTSPSPALKLGAAAKDPMFGENQDKLVEASTLAGLPGLSIPCGFQDGLPVGMQMFAPQFQEKIILSAGKRYQELTDFHKKRP